MADPADYGFLAKPIPRPQTSIDLTMQAYSNIIDDRKAREARVARVLSRSNGLPAPTVEADIPGFELEQHNNDTYHYLTSDPHLTQFVADPHNAAAVKDDLPALANTSAIFKTLDGWDHPDLTNHMKAGHSLLSAFDVLPKRDPNWAASRAKPGDIRNMVAAAPPRVNWGQGLVATARASATAAGIAATDLLSFGDRGDYDQMTADLKQFEQTSAAPAQQQFDIGGPVHHLVGNAYQAAQSLEMMGMAVLTGNPITAMGLQAGTQQFADVRGRGGGKGEALLSGAVSGAAEAGFEKYFGLGWMLGNYGKAVEKKALGKFVTGLLAREVPSEMATTAVQNLADAMTTGGGGWEQYKKNLPQDLLDTALSTALMVGAVGGAGYVHSRLSRERTAVEQIDAAHAGGAFLDDLASAVEQSKTKKEDPQTLSDFIAQRTENTPVRNVFVPIEAVASYMQSDQYKGEFDPYQEQIAQAQQTQGDVVIPIGEALAHLAGTPAWEALKGDMRVAPGGLSRNEAEKQHGEIINVLEQRGKEIADAAHEAGAARTANEEVYTDVKNRLRVGGMDDSQAEKLAQLYAAHYSTVAQGFGSTPMEEWQRAKVTLPGEQTGQAAGRQMAQLDTPSQLNTPRNPTAAEMRKLSRVETVPLTQARQGNRLDWERFNAGKHPAPLLKGFADKPVAVKMENGEYVLLDGNHRASLADARGDSSMEMHVISARDYDPANMGRAPAASHINDEELNQLLREFYQGPRGTTTITDQGDRIIQLFATADRSTFLHETGHVWLEELKANAARPDAPDQLKADWATVQKWFAANKAAVKNQVIPTEAHELFARGFERYLMEGKAPSTELRGVFKTFRAWLLRIYQVVQNLHSPISPEIREVFDRTLATQEAIDVARQTNDTEPLFKTAEEAGMTEAEFADYQKRVGDARDEAYDTLLYKTMEAIRRQRTEDGRRQRAAIRDEVAKEVNAQPQFRLLHLLRTGRWLGEPDRAPVKVKLNSGWLMDSFGEGILDKLPKGPKLIAANGEDGDTIAEMIGLESGSQVVHLLVGMREAADQNRAAGENRSVRELVIERQVDAIMMDRHGDPLNDGTIEEEAIAALNTARQGEIIASEIKQLGKRKSVLGVPTPYEFAREWARRTVVAGHVRDVASRAALQRYTRAANKSARAAEDAILAGDIDEAYRQKQAQLLNHALLAEAKAAADRVDRIVARMKKIAGRAAMKSVDPEYLDKIHLLLENYDFRNRSQRSIDEQIGFEDWIENQRAKGFEVHIPPRLENKGDPYTRVSVQELESLDDLVESLLKLGRTKQKLKLAKEERDFGEFRDDVLARIEGMRNRSAHKPRFWKSGKLVANSPINEQERRGAAAASELLKVETIVEELDGAKTGPLHDAIVLGATNAENHRFDLRAKVLKPLAESYNKMGRKQWRRLQDRITIPELTWNTLNEGDPRIGQTVTLTRMELLSVLMNMGNLSNLEKLSKGERWPVETLRAVVNRELSKEDFDLAQKLWDQVELLWPDIVATEGEMAGIVPEKVINSPIETPHGTYRGGYWPVVYDAARWQRAEDLEGKQLDDMFGIKSGVATQKGHTITRTGAFGPINLSLENVLFRHIEQVVTRVAFASYARDVMRIVRDPSIRGMIDTKLGSEYRKQIEKWLARQVHEGAVYAKAARWWDGLLRQLRINMTIAAMGLRFSTGVAQTIGLTASAQRIGSRWVGTGMKRLALSPRESAQFAYARSPELLHRAEAVNREISELNLKMRQKHSWWTDAQHWAMWHIGFVDRYMVALPTWLGAHAKGMKDGMTDEQASAYADKEVRQSQGSGREKDLSAFQSPNSEAMRFFSMFYTPWNVLFNAQWQGVRGLKDTRKEFLGIKGDPRPLIAVSFWWLTVSMLGDAMLSGDWPDDETPESWTRWAGRNVFFGLFSGIPLVRDFANAAERKVAGQYSDYSQTPVTRVFDAVDKAWKAGQHVAQGEPVKNPIKQTGDIAGALFGMPTSQIGATSQFLWDRHTGAQDPQSVSDWYFGITKGKLPDSAKVKEQPSPSEGNRP